MPEDIKKNPSQSKGFLDYFNDPTSIISDTKFLIASSALQFVGLIVFAVLGTNISFRFNTFKDLLNLDYWITVVVMLVEQLYAYNIGYNIGKPVMLSANKELKTTNEQITMINEGVFKEIKDNDGKVIEEKELMPPLKRDLAYVDPILNDMNEEVKINLVTKRMKELIEFFETQKELFRGMKYKFWLFGKKIKITKKQKRRFFKKSTAITFCEKQIADGNTLLEDKETILAIPDRNVKNFQRLESANLISSQEEVINEDVSPYHQRSEQAERAKTILKKSITKLLLAAIGGSVAFGALLGENAGGIIAYTIFIMLVQLGYGFKDGIGNVVKIILYNATNRLKALKEVQRRLPLKKQELQKIENKGKIS